MNKKANTKQTAKAMAMVGHAQTVRRPSNVEDVEKETQQDVITKLRKDRKTEPKKDKRRDFIDWRDKDNHVTVGAKVPANVSMHWTIEAKKQRTSVSYVISKALIEAFGVPDGAIAEEGQKDN